MPTFIPANPLDSSLDAQMVPTGELRVLRELERGLPQQHFVFHGVHWSHVGQRHSVFGEIDFVIMDPMSNLLAIEHKDAVATLQGQELVVQYKGKTKPVVSQLQRNLAHLRRAFLDQTGNAFPLPLDYLLYLPHSRVQQLRAAGVDASRLLDLNSKESLCDWILRHFEGRRALSSGQSLENRSQMVEFLSNIVHAKPSIGQLGEDARQLVKHLSGGLSTWASRLRLHPHRLHIVGTAGSGKTQHALDEIRRATRRGQSSLYLCFNRPLAEAMRQQLPPRATALTAHELGRKLWELVHDCPMDIAGRESAFQDMIDALIAHAPGLAGSFQTLVIDEAQDLHPDWLQALLQIADDRTRVTVLEDPCQELYGRPPVHLTGAGWVQMDCPVNLRSPRLLVEFVNLLGLTPEPVESGSPFDGFNPEVRVVEGDSFWADTEQAVLGLLKDGFKLKSIAVLTDRGASRSPLLTQLRALEKPSLAGVRARIQTGYQPSGEAVWSEGELLVESVYRFKGQSADAIVLTEIDWDRLDQATRNRLFVGLTRARLKVVMVISERAWEALGWEGM